MIREKHYKLTKDYYVAIKPPVRGLREWFVYRGINQNVWFASGSNRGSTPAQIRKDALKALEKTLRHGS